MRSDPWHDLLDLINGFQITQAVYVASTLGLADHLMDGPRSAGELASLTQSHAGALYRLLRALSAVGVFQEHDGQRFTLTAMGECLRTGSATPIGAYAEHVGSAYFWKAWGHLQHSVRTGENAFRDLYDKDIWQYRAEHPEESAMFNRAMTQMSRGSAEAVIGAYDFSACCTIVDVGGGHGLLLAAILNAYGRMRGTLFDQPAVVAGAKAVLTERGVIDRCEIVGGNFFETAPGGGDAYLMRQIIHDWEDDDAIAILKVCRRVMRESARLLLIEQIVAPANENPAAKFSDLNMLVAPGGRERTRDEFSDLLTQSDFKLARVVPAGRSNVIEARPV
jgi:hypothetical protein